jgi:hypothetical protein
MQVEKITIVLEAEAGAVVAPMIVVTPVNASGISGGNFVKTIEGYGGSITLTFSVSVAGTYVIWGRVNAMLTLF